MSENSPFCGSWNKSHISVTYRGVDITKEIGLCVCENCTEKIRKRIDLEIEARRVCFKCGSKHAKYFLINSVAEREYCPLVCDTCKMEIISDIDKGILKDNYSFIERSHVAEGGPENEPTN